MEEWKYATSFEKIAYLKIKVITSTINILIVVTITTVTVPRIKKYNLFFIYIKDLGCKDF